MNVVPVFDLFVLEMCRARVVVALLLHRHHGCSSVWMKDSRRFFVLCLPSRMAERVSLIAYGTVSPGLSRRKAVYGDLCCAIVLLGEGDIVSLSRKTCKIVNMPSLFMDFSLMCPSVMFT